MLNPYASPAMQGIGPSAPPQYIDVPFSYVYDVTLDANESLPGEVVSIFTEADFAWRGLFFTATALFSVRFQDGQGYWLSAAMIFSSNMPNSAGDPFPQFPEVLYPAGGRIFLDIQDLSGDENTVQIVFIGANRYRVQG